MLNLLANWRMMLWIGFHVVLIVGSFLPNWRVAGRLVERATEHRPRSLARDPPGYLLSWVVVASPARVSLGQSRDAAESEHLVLGKPVASTGGFDLDLVVLGVFPRCHLACDDGCRTLGVPKAD